MKVLTTKSNIQQGISNADLPGGLPYFMNRIVVKRNISVRLFLTKMDSYIMATMSLFHNKLNKPLGGIRQAKTRRTITHSFDNRSIEI
jgi:hypothetical protein